jgi:hypothetical protein
MKDKKKCPVTETDCVAQESCEDCDQYCFGACVGCVKNMNGVER